jgi:hypothetical protein
MERAKIITVRFSLTIGVLASTVVTWIAAQRAEGAVLPNPMRVTVEQDTLSIYAEDCILMQYHYDNVPFKPYVQQLFSPEGINVLRDAPADHLHHHALMFAVAVDGVNFWEEQQAPGRQEHQAFTDVTVDKHGDIPWAGFMEQLAWLNPSGKELLLNEQRTIRLCQPGDPKVTLLTWESRFEVPKGKKSAMLAGSHYFGLGMRFLESMDKAGRHLNASGKAGEVFRGDERLVWSDWCAYTASANGKPVTVAMFGHPDNLRHPTQWFTMTKPFAYLSATLNLHKEPLKIVSGKPLMLRYGVALWDGQVGQETIEHLYKQWAAWPPQEANVTKAKQLR